MEIKKRITDAVLGVAVGDALGVPVEFFGREVRKGDPVTGMRGGGWHNQKPGTWSDDTSMALALMDSLTRKGFDPEDQMRCYVNWLYSFKYTARDDVFDVGNTCRAAIQSYVCGVPVSECGATDDHSSGNGSLMRIMPMALWLCMTGRDRLDDGTAGLIHVSSAVTHATLCCQMACGIYCAVVFRLWRGEGPKDAVEKGVRDALAYYGGLPAFAGEMKKFGSLETIAVWPEQMIRSGGYVLDTLQAALWCFLQTDSYAECVLKAVNLGRDTDTTGAVAGGLAGLAYGEESIPGQWLEVLARREDIRSMCSAFAESIEGAVS